MTITIERQELDRWQGLQNVPSGPRAGAAARVARRLFTAAVDRLDVTVLVGEQVLGRGGPVAVVHRPDEFFARLGRDQLIGFGEAYLTGAWDAEDLAGFLAVLAADLPSLVPAPLQRLRSLVVARPPRQQRGSRRHTRDNVAHHYDLSNDLFGVFLDPSLSYSAALFADDPGSVTRVDLEAAQHRKIDRLLDLAGVGAGTRLLEIGTGWGELAIRAARRGAIVHSITLSVEQQRLAQDRVAAAGVADRVDIEICDYRAVTGSYDAVVSVEMIEAVGWRYWRTYFETIDRLLRPGGRAAVQAITMPHDRMLATRNTHTWINKYIFPGGFLPSVRAIDEVTRTYTALRLSDRLAFGQHYAATLRLWDQAFRAAATEVRGLGFDETFQRMWHFYLEYSRAGFASGYLDVHQLTFAKTGEPSE
jgi:cyclopropane-fatty-acyl-phospholipid synthase